MASKLSFLSFVVLAMAALVAGGCGSDSSSTPTAVDTAPPAVPTGLSADVGAGNVALAWAPNTTDADFAGFVVDRIYNGATTSLIDTPQDITSFEDPDPEMGYSIYAVSAVDRSGNESAYASIGVVIQYHHTPEQPANH